MSAPSTPNQAAAKWWADQLRNGTKQDNGVPMHGMLATALGQGSGGDIDRFEAELLAKLDQGNPRIVSTDYDPDSYLRDAADASGVRPSCGPFPMKTVMWIDASTVKVKHGYGAATKTIFQSTNL